MDLYGFVIFGIIKELCNGVEYKVFIYKDWNGMFLCLKVLDNSFIFNGLVYVV